MVARISLLCVFTAALITVPGTAIAQDTGGSQRVSNATELDPEDPRAKRASALVTVLMGNDAAAAQKYLKAHALPTSPASADVPKLVKDLQACSPLGLSSAG